MSSAIPSPAPFDPPGVIFRAARLDDVPALVALENRSFAFDRLSRRSFTWMIRHAHRFLDVAEADGRLLGYVLVLYRRGTSLARLYSLAVEAEYRKAGIARRLLEIAEAHAEAEGCMFMRLEVHPDNRAAIALYERMGYRCCGRYEHYYEDGSAALRYERRIHSPDTPAGLRATAYYAQTTEFTCGPASLMMAMHAFGVLPRFTRHCELQLWREATTIYMTSGHGGCSPYGLALAARRRGLAVELFVSEHGPLFLDGVRDEAKKDVLRIVHEDFVAQVAALGIPVRHGSVGQQQLSEWLDQGALPIVLISTWRFNRNKAPHWVLLTGHDERFFYIHDPDLDEEDLRSVTDNMYLPIARGEFERISRFGRVRLQSVVVVRRPAGVIAA